LRSCDIVLCSQCMFFFFSSRRRHTRFSRDWSSDVCSSDLNDIASPTGKIGGAAQKRLANGGILHHATLSYDIDGQVMTEVLRIGREKLSDKGTTSAAKRVDPLRSQTGMERRAILDAFMAQFEGFTGAARGHISDEEYAAAEELVRTKFSTDSW